MRLLSGFVTVLTIIFWTVAIFPLQKLASFDSDGVWRAAEQTEDQENRLNSDKLQKP